MRKYIRILMIFIALSFTGFTLATVKACDDVWPGPKEIYGEITGITPTQLMLNQSGRSTLWRMTPGTRIFCNGMPAVWQALLPVTSQSFFEAWIRLDDRGEVAVIYGFYQGEICILRGWRYLAGGILEVELTGADSGITRWRRLAPDARVPQTSWLAEESEVYVLYNQTGAVRGIYLPDL